MWHFQFLHQKTIQHSLFISHHGLCYLQTLVCIATAMLAYKTVSGTKSFRKLVHLVLQFMAFFLSLIGVWAAWKFHIDKGIDNFYSLHSWLGLACLFLFGVQVLSLSSLMLLFCCILFPVLSLCIIIFRGVLYMIVHKLVSQ